RAAARHTRDAVVLGDPEPVVAERLRPPGAGDRTVQGLPVGLTGPGAGTVEQGQSGRLGHLRGERRRTTGYSAPFTGARLRAVRAPATSRCCRWSTMARCPACSWT